jgi:hypothetical protein
MNNRFLLGLLAVLFVGTSAVQAQKFSKVDVSPADIASYPSNYKESDKKVRVIYSRPKLTSPKTGEKRSVATLAEYGKVWRTGANEAPEITFYQDVVFGGANVKAGTYALFTIPGEGEWTVILNNNLNQWGAYFYDSTADVVRVKATESTDSTSLESFSMAYKKKGNGVELVMGWDKTRVSVPISW